MNHLVSRISFKPSFPVISKNVRSKYCLTLLKCPVEFYEEVFIYKSSSAAGRTDQWCIYIPMSADDDL